MGLGAGNLHGTIRQSRLSMACGHPKHVWKELTTVSLMQTRNFVPDN